MENDAFYVTLWKMTHFNPTMENATMESVTMENVTMESVTMEKDVVPKILHCSNKNFSEQTLSVTVNLFMVIKKKFQF